MSTRLRARLLAGALGTLVVSFAAIAWLLSPTAGRTDHFVVQQGEGLREVSADLAAQHLVRSRTACYLLGRLLDVGSKLRAGYYAIDGRAGTRRVLLSLTGAGLQGQVTIPEGYSVRQMDRLFAERGIVQAGAFLAAAQDATPYLTRFPWLSGLPAGAGLEGFLFPDTYDVDGPASPSALIDLMLADFQRKALPLLKGTSAMPVFRAVTLASIVEQEAVRPEERPIIAGVFLNRLRIGMPLGSDPTVEYALGRREGAHGLSLDDVAIDSPYNTYRYPGLPPGPIDSPGIDSIRAVLAAAEGPPTPYLYFVARGDGTHQFSRTYAEQLQAQRRYQLHRRTPSR